MKGKFVEGCKKNGHAPEICEKIWTDWEAFAQYAFKDGFALFDIL